MIIFSHMSRHVSVFLKCDTIFRLLFFGNYHKFELSSCSSFRDIRGSQIYFRRPCAPPPDASIGKILTHLQVLAYTIITVKFQLRVAPLTSALSIIGFALKCPQNTVLGVGEKIFGGKVHPSLELRVFRHLWSRSDAPYSSILYRYSHLP